MDMHFNARLQRSLCSDCALCVMSDAMKIEKKTTDLCDFVAKLFTADNFYGNETARK